MPNDDHTPDFVDRYLLGCAGVLGGIMLLSGIAVYVVEWLTGAQDRGTPGVLLRVGGMVLLMIWGRLSRQDKRTAPGHSSERAEKNDATESSSKTS